MKRTFVLAMLLAPLLGLAMASVHVWLLFQEKYDGPAVVFTVRPGDTFGVVNARLYQAELINNTRLFHWWARYRGEMEKLRAGAFEIPTGANIAAVLHTLVHGQPILNAVTVPEGKNLWEIAAILERAGFGPRADFLAYARDPATLAKHGVPGPSLEGYLFPETYKFAPGTAVSEIADTMVAEFKRRVGSLNVGHPFLSPHEVVVLASMVEKETGAKAERPQIASVFLNRLKKRMRLESDPTTIYGMGEAYAGNLRKDDLLRVTPYNTYKIPALPAGPIASPSLEAVQAVMRPAVSDNLFFVSRNDGTHVFTPTYAEHLKAVKEWQINRANRAGRSWRQLKQ